MTSARVLADSTNAAGVRLTSFEVTFHRFILAEVNTHAALSRNSASSRAIPFRKQLERVTRNPAVPVSFPEEQRGMSGGAELEGLARERAVNNWLAARDVAMAEAQRLAALGVHKSVCNRILEPYQWHTAVITGTAWLNFFRQRKHPAAQPEFRVLAEAMHEAWLDSTPVFLEEGQWHLPYLDGETITEVTDHLPPAAATDTLVKVSVARCARTSYMTQDGRRDYEEDLALFDRLATADPPHASPFEHVATSALWNTERVNVRDPDTGKLLTPPLDLPRIGKARTWLQYRHLVEARNGYVSFE